MQEPWSSRSAKTPPKHGWAATTASRPPGRSTRRGSASTGRRSSEVSGCHDGGYGVDGLVGEREPAGAAHDCGQSCSAGDVDLACGDIDADHAPAQAGQCRSVGAAAAAEIEAETVIAGAEDLGEQAICGAGERLSYPAGDVGVVPIGEVVVTLWHAITRAEQDGRPQSDLWSDPWGWSAAWAGHGGTGRQPADSGCLVGGSAQAGDLLVLSGQPGQGSGSEAGELGDRFVAAADAVFESGDLGFQPADLGVTRVGRVAGLADSCQPGFELLAQMGVGAGAVEGGAVHSRFVSEGFDVAFPAGRDLPAKEPVDGGPDPGLVLVALLCAESHVFSPVAVVWAAASISERTRAARSYSACSRVLSVLRVGPRLPRNALVLSACSAQTGRGPGWWVACGQRAESHIPASGLSACGVPASFRQSARDGSVNQQ